LVIELFISVDDLTATILPMPLYKKRPPTFSCTNMELGRKGELRLTHVKEFMHVVHFNAYLIKSYPKLIFWALCIPYDLPWG